MSSPNNTYALILAGGSGTRFWPLSRNSCPKQLLDLFGSGTCDGIEDAYAEAARAAGQSPVTTGRATSGGKRWVRIPGFTRISSRPGTSRRGAT